MVTFTSGSYAQQNPQVVADFKAAMTETLALAQANPDKVRALLPAFMKMPEAVAKGLRLSPSTASSMRPSWANWAS